MSANQNIYTVQDYEDVLAAMEGYAQGLKTGNVDQLKKTFHQDAKHPPQQLFALKWNMMLPMKISPITIH